MNVNDLFYCHFHGWFYVKWYATYSVRDSHVPSEFQLFSIGIPFFPHLIRFVCVYVFFSFNWNFKSESFVLSRSRYPLFCCCFFLNKYPGFIMCVRHMNWLSAGREVEKYIPNIKPKNIFILRIFAVFVPFIDTFLFQRDDEWCQIKTGINGRKKVMCF